MSITEHDAHAHLVALGFTEIEAAAYTFLLGEYPATGYRVAQAIGRTAANTYKALEALESRGAVMSEERDTRVYRAVAPDELLRTLEATFNSHRKSAAALLKRASTEVSDDRVYQLRTASQVFERARAILRAAKHVVLLDAFPMPLSVLHADILAASKRGVRIALLAYEPIQIAGVEVVLNHQAETVNGRWPGQWLNIAADSTQQVHALLTPDGAEVAYATWSGSPFFAHLYQSGLLGELAASAMRNALREKRTPATIQKMLKRLDVFEHTDTPALAHLAAAPLRRAQPRGGV